MRRSASVSSTGEHRQPEGEEEVFEDLDVGRDRGAPDLALARDVGHVERSGVHPEDGLSSGLL